MSVYSLNDRELEHNGVCVSGKSRGVGADILWMLACELCTFG